MRTNLLGRLLIGAMALAAPQLRKVPGSKPSSTLSWHRCPHPAKLRRRLRDPLEQQIAQLADGSDGRIGVYAIDLSTGREVGVLADQRFPMASTSKVAIAATFLAGVDANRWSLTSEYRLPRPGGAYLPAYRHLSLMISKSCNDCTDALLAAVSGERCQQVDEGCRDRRLQPVARHCHADPRGRPDRPRVERRYQGQRHAARDGAAACRDLSGQMAERLFTPGPARRDGGNHHGQAADVASR